MATFDAIDLSAGERITFESGAQRDSIAERYDLVPPCAIRRLARIYAEGAKKYGLNNWQKGLPTEDTLNHMLRHLYLYMDGDKNEDHIAKVMWGCATLIYFEVNRLGVAKEK